MKIIGITGPSGAGKSTVLARFSERGVKVIKADEVYHDLLRADVSLLKNLKNQFPQAFRDGLLDRTVLGRTVFADKGAKAELEKITHPAVLKRLESYLDSFRESGEKMAAVEAIALIESGLSGICDAVIAVLSRRDLMAARVVARDGIGLHDAAARLGAQPGDAFYREYADYVLENNGNQDELAQLADNILNEMERTTLK
jgi:dephospho-CoA kinase